MNLSWPDFAKVPTGVEDADVAGTIAALQEIFDQLIITSRMVASRMRVQDDRFGGWLCYSNFDRAWKAVNTRFTSSCTHGDWAYVNGPAISPSHGGASPVASLVTIGPISSSGTNRLQRPVPPKHATCLMSVLETCEYSPSAIRNTVSTAGSRRDDW